MTPHLIVVVDMARHLTADKLFALFDCQKVRMRTRLLLIAVCCHTTSEQYFPEKF